MPSTVAVHVSPTKLRRFGRLTSFPSELGASAGISMKSTTVVKVLYKEVSVSLTTETPLQEATRGSWPYY